MNGSLLHSQLGAHDKQLLMAILQKRLKALDDIERIKSELKSVDDDIDQIERGRTLDRTKDHTRHGIKKFNLNPKVGIDYLVRVGKIKLTPQSVAKFLFDTGSLNKTSLGVYLGDGEDFPISVLGEFAKLHDFTNLSLDTGLRNFLFSFRLPGEAQKIDRMMQCFASQYCACNPNIFANEDSCYILSFAIIMMNTSIHNPSVKNKPTVKHFIEMNRGVNNGADFPEQMLTDLFENIKAEQFKIPPEDAVENTFFDPDLQGWLMKQGGRVKSWKKRWFVLVGNCLYYFEEPSHKEPKGIIPLQNLEVREVADKKKMHCFEIYIPETVETQTIKAAKTSSGGRMYEGRHTTYLVSAPTEKEKKNWIRSIRKCNVANDPYYEMIAAKKRLNSMRMDSSAA